MTTPAMKEKTPHHGKNVKRVREMLGIKQDALALDLNMSQQNMSVLESKEIIEDELMEQIAAILKVPVEVIRNFDEEKAIYNIQHNYEGSNPNAGSVVGGAYNYYSTVNPIEKWIDALEENKKLYTALLKEKDEKNALLERLLKEKK